MLNTLANESSPLPPEEPGRAEILRHLKLADTQAGPAFDALVETARSLTGCSSALVSLVDVQATWHVASAGLNVRRSEPEQSFCAHAIAEPRFFEVADLAADPRFASHPLVAAPSGLRHYAAVPLVLEGCAIGTLCVLDPAPGALSTQARGQLANLAGVVCELLRQRQHRLRLEVQNERLRDLTRASGDWAWELDATLNCRWVAGDFEAVTGLTLARVIGRPVHADPLVDASGLDRSPARSFLDVLAERQPFSRVVTRLQTPRGALLTSHSALPVFDAKGEFRGYRGTTRDVTARVERELLLRDKTALQEASRAKSAFLSRVSHELRTPLNAILGFAQLMALDQDQPLSAQQLHKLGGVRQAGQQLLDMVNDVLDIARIQQGAMPLQPRSAHLADIVATCLHAVQPLASARPVTVQAQVPQGLHVWVDTRALEQVLLNLLSNAIKFNRPGGSVVLAATSSAGSTELSVTDTGAGLSADDVAQLFQPFNRLGAERKRIAGSGLGLVIVRELALAMGGDVTVASQPGQGSRFSVTLPTAAATTVAPEAPPQRTEEAVPPHCVAPRQVLYIEDEPLNVLLMQEVFRAQPAWTLHVAETGEAGVATALRLRPDLALIDMNLPDINGLEVLRRLRAHPDTRELRCIALSADAMQDQISAARAAGFDDYWTKPIDLTQLLVSVAQAFEITR
ncbi:MAG: response regulator [Vitreoscilla sp.]|nr:response regulator [Vitreoscilla sp.]